MGKIPGYFEVNNITETLREASQLTNIATENLPHAEHGTRSRHLKTLQRGPQETAARIEPTIEFLPHEDQDQTPVNSPEPPKELYSRDDLPSAGVIRSTLTLDVSVDSLDSSSLEKVAPSPSFHDQERESPDADAADETQAVEAEVDVPAVLTSTLRKADLENSFGELLGHDRFRDIPSNDVIVESGPTDDAETLVQPLSRPISAQEQSKAPLPPISVDSFQESDLSQAAPQGLVSIFPAEVMTLDLDCKFVTFFFLIRVSLQGKFWHSEGKFGLLSDNQSPKSS